MSTPDPGLEPDEEEPLGDAGRRSARPLVWLLLAIALLALLWYISRDRQPEPVPAGPLATVTEPVDDAQTPGDAEEEADSVPSPDAAPRPDPEPDPLPADRAAEPVTRVQPEYPIEALRTRQEGTVLLRVEVDAQGNAASVEIESSSRSRDLDRAARDAVAQWRFRPAIEDGRPVPSTVTVPVDFRVD